MHYGLGQAMHNADPILDLREAMADYLSSLYFNRCADSCIITYSLNEWEAFRRIVYHVLDVSMCNVSQNCRGSCSVLVPGRYWVARLPGNQ